jgi:hypothetical protein
MPTYPTWEKGWVPKPCSVCNVTATAHAVLYAEEPPEPPTPDKRKPIGEVWRHEGTRDDCIRPPELAAALLSPEKAE